MESNPTGNLISYHITYKTLSKFVWIRIGVILCTPTFVIWFYWCGEFRNKRSSSNSDKGQLISKCIFGVFNFFQNANENKSTLDIIVVKSNSFVRFGRIHGLTICFRVLLTFTIFAPLKIFCLSIFFVNRICKDWIEEKVEVVLFYSISFGNSKSCQSLMHWH